MANLIELVQYQQIFVSAMGDAPSQWAPPVESSVDTTNYNLAVIQVSMDTFSPSGGFGAGVCRFVVQGSNDRETFVDIVATQAELSIVPPYGKAEKLDTIIEFKNFPKYLRGVFTADSGFHGTINTRVVLSLSKNQG